MGAPGLRHGYPHGRRALVIHVVAIGPPISWLG